jgi:hypothetical protein
MTANENANKKAISMDIRTAAVVPRCLLTTPSPPSIP